MADDNRQEVINLPPIQQKSILDHPFVREIGTDLIKQYAKQQLGLKSTGNENKNAKGPVTRLVYAARDFIQGTFWVFLISAFCMMMTYIFYLWLRKALGV